MKAFLRWAHAHQLTFKRDAHRRAAFKVWLKFTENNRVRDAQIKELRKDLTTVMAILQETEQLPYKAERNDSTDLHAASNANH